MLCLIEAFIPLGVVEIDIYTAKTASGREVRGPDGKDDDEDIDDGKRLMLSFLERKTGCKNYKIVDEKT